MFERILLSIMGFPLCTCCLFAAGLPPARISVSIQIAPESSSLYLVAPNGIAYPYQASTPVLIKVAGNAENLLRPVHIYACLTTDEAMRYSRNGSTMAIAGLHIRNEQGDWMPLEPLTELEGRRGVRIAIVNGPSARILLQVQLQVPKGQTPGNYQGILTLVAQEQ